MNRIKLAIFYTFLLTICLITTGLAQNAGMDSMLINYVESQDSGDNLRLRIYFTPLNQTNQPIRNVDLENANVTVNGATIQAQLQDDIDIPLQLVLLLDMSGSMKDVVNNMRVAALTAIDKAPADSQIAVTTFNTLSQRTNFMNKDDARQIVNAISAQDAANGTCLFDSTIDAVSQLRQGSTDALSRRAVILFTDGKDRLRQDDPTPCSKSNAQEVISAAQYAESPVPIYAIGLGDFDESLFSIANQTGGIGIEGQSGRLTSAFEQIMDSLAAQWLAEVDLTIPAGEYAGTFNVLSADKTLSESFSFVNSHDYAPVVTVEATPSMLLPPTVQKLDLKKDEENGQWIVDITAENAKSVDLWEISIVAAREGSEVLEETYPPSDLQNIVISAENLEYDVQYDVLVSATDNAGSYFTADRGGVILFEKSFTHWSESILQEPLLEIDRFEANLEAGTLKVVLNRSNLPADSELKWVLEDSKANSKTITTTEEAGDYYFSLTEFGGTDKYLIKVSVEGETVSAEKEYEWESKKPGLITRLIDGFKDNWYLLFLLLGIILLAIIFFMWRSSQESQRSGTPFAQQKGLLGKKMDKQAKEELADTTSLYEPEGNDAPWLDDAWNTSGFEPNMLAQNKASLTVTESPAPIGKRFPIPMLRTPFILGREDADLIIEEPHVSRRHVQIEERNDEYYIQDLGSSNYTFLNGVKLTPHKQHVLKNGAIIALGRKTIIEFKVQ